MIHPRQVTPLSRRAVRRSPPHLRAREKGAPCLGRLCGGRGLAADSRLDVRACLVRAFATVPTHAPTSVDPIARSARDRATAPRPSRKPCRRLRRARHLAARARVVRSACRAGPPRRVVAIAASAAAAAFRPPPPSSPSPPGVGPAQLEGLACRRHPAPPPAVPLALNPFTFHYISAVLPHPSTPFILLQRTRRVQCLAAAVAVYILCVPEP